jgi:hypothetical protein
MATDRDTTTTAPLTVVARGPITEPLPAIPGQRIELTGTLARVAHLLDRWIDTTLTTTALTTALAALAWPKLPTPLPPGLTATEVSTRWQRALRNALLPVLDDLAAHAAPITTALTACTWDTATEVCPRCRQLLGTWWDTRHAAAVTVITDVPTRAHLSLTGGTR